MATNFPRKLLSFNELSHKSIKMEFKYVCIQSIRLLCIEKNYTTNIGLHGSKVLTILSPAGFWPGRHNSWMGKILIVKDLGNIFGFTLYIFFITSWFLRFLSFYVSNICADFKRFHMDIGWVSWRRSFRNMNMCKEVKR